MRKCTLALITAVGSIAVYECLRRKGVIDHLEDKAKASWSTLSDDTTQRVKRLYHRRGCCCNHRKTDSDISEPTEDITHGEDGV